MPTEINGYSPSEETALSSLIINEVDSTETFKKMKEKNLLQDNQLYLVTDEQDSTVIDEIPTEGSKNLVYSGGVYNALKQVGSADSVIEQNKGLEQKFWRGTKEEFNAVGTKSNDTMYIITDEEGNVSGGAEIFVGPEAPTDDSNVWIDTDAELSGGGVDIPAGDNEPATGNYWLDTSAEGGTYYTAGEVDTLLAGKVNTSSVYTKTETNTLLQNKAPAGYGLGTAAAELPSMNLDSITYNGWYVIGSTSGLTNPPPFGWGVLHVYSRNSNNVVQEVVGADKKVRRYCADGTWQPWEWVNPPMITTGEEYRTTERFYGFPVYKKLVTLGKAPAAGSIATIDGGHGISGIKYAISAVPLIYKSNWTTALQDNSRVDDVDFSTTSISVKISSDGGDLTSYDLLVLLTYAKEN